MEPKAPETYSLSPAKFAAMYGINSSKVRALIMAGDLGAIDISMHKGVGKPRWRITRDHRLAFERDRASKPAAKVMPKPRPRRATPTRQYIK